MESRSDDEIFVAIAAYRDPELRLTIENCVAHAARPERLRFGVCLQHDAVGPPEVQPDCLDGIDASVRLLSYDWTESKGGCWARHLAQSLYDGEGYTLQLDSHMRMEPAWDVALVEMVERFPGDKPLVTGQCPLYELVDGRDVFPETMPEVPVTVALDCYPRGWIHHPSVDTPVDDARPRPTRILSGMFVFTLGQWNLEVRQDPEHLYTGEELALTIRSFTWGYDLYNPDRVVAWHRYHPQGNVRYIHEAERAEVSFREERAFRRLQALQRGDPDRVLGRYGVGPVRTVDEYCRWAGFDFEARAVDEAAREGVSPPVYEPDW